MRRLVITVMVEGESWRNSSQEQIELSASDWGPIAGMACNFGETVRRMIEVAMDAVRAAEEGGGNETEQEAS